MQKCWERDKKWVWEEEKDTKVPASVFRRQTVGNARHALYTFCIDYFAYISIH